MVIIELTSHGFSSPKGTHGTLVERLEDDWDGAPRFSARMVGLDTHNLILRNDDFTVIDLRA